MPGTCKRAAYLGSRAELVVDTPWGELLVFDPEVRASAKRGDAVGLAFDAGDAIVLPR